MKNHFKLRHAILICIATVLLVQISIMGTNQNSGSKSITFLRQPDAANLQEYYSCTLPEMIFSDQIGAANFDSDIYNEVAIVNYNGIKVFDLQTSEFIVDLGAPSDFDFSNIDFADINNDGIAEIIFSERGSRIVAMQQDGSILWQYKPYTANVYSNGINFMDLDLDGSLDVVQYSGDGSIFGYRGYDGVKIFEKWVSGGGSLIAIGDFNATTGQEIAFSSSFQSFITDRQGNITHQVDLEISSGGGYIYGEDIAIGNFSDDALDDIALTVTLEDGVKTAYIRIIEAATGTLIWKHDQLGQYKALTANDESNPSLRRIFLLTSTNQIKEFSDFSTNNSAPTSTLSTTSEANQLEIIEISAGVKRLLGYGYGGFLYDMEAHIVQREYTGKVGFGELSGDSFTDVIEIDDDQLTVYSTSPSTDPRCNSPDDLRVDIGEGTSIEWQIEDPNTSSGQYSVYLDGELMGDYDEQTWESGESFFVDVDTSEEGRYEYELKFTDGVWTKFDVVKVNIGASDDDKPFIPGYPLLIFCGMSGVAILFLTYGRKTHNT